MSYVNTGALVNGRRPATKAALKAALKDAPDTVEFDSTALMGPRAGETLTVATLGTDTASVTGPDPYTRRDWYASVSVRDGKVKVS